MSRIFNVSADCKPALHYLVLSLDFQRLSQKDFEAESCFVEAVAGAILKQEVFLEPGRHSIYTRQWTLSFFSEGNLFKNFPL